MSIYKSGGSNGSFYLNDLKGSKHGLKISKTCSINSEKGNENLNNGSKDCSVNLKDCVSDTVPVEK